MFQKLYTSREVTDNWKDNYPGNTIEIFVAMQNNRVIINASGNYDYGVEKVKTYPSHKEAKEGFKEAMEFCRGIPEIVNVNWFLKRGFKFI